MLRTVVQIKSVCSHCKQKYSIYGSIYGSIYSNQSESHAPSDLHVSTADISQCNNSTIFVHSCLMGSKDCCAQRFAQTPTFKVISPMM